MTIQETNGHGGEIVEAVAVQEPAQPPANLFNTDDPVEVVERAARVADSLRDVISKRHLYKQIKGKNHVLVEGWQLLGSMLGVTAVCVDTEEVDGGWKATVEARTLDGRVIGRADALCTKHERSGPWKNADDYARLSMAQTRATSKALKGPLGFVISLAGYESTPEPEMTFADGEDAAVTVSNAGPVQEQVTDAEPVEKITAKRAKQLAELYDGLGMLDNVPLAIGRLVGEQPGDCATVTKAAKALRVLTDEQADQAESWANRKADEEVAA